MNIFEFINFVKSWCFLRASPALTLCRECSILFSLHILHAHGRINAPPWRMRPNKVLSYVSNPAVFVSLLLQQAEGKWLFIMWPWLIRIHKLKKKEKYRDINPESFSSLIWLILHLDAGCQNYTDYNSGVGGDGVSSRCSLQLYWCVTVCIIKSEQPLYFSSSRITKLTFCTIYLFIFWRHLILNFIFYKKILTSCYF